MGAGLLSPPARRLSTLIAGEAESAAPDKSASAGATLAPPETSSRDATLISCGLERLDQRWSPRRRDARIAYASDSQDGARQRDRIGRPALLSSARAPRRAFCRARECRYDDRRSRERRPRDRRFACMSDNPAIPRRGERSGRALRGSRPWRFRQSKCLRERHRRVVGGAPLPTGDA
jgi:hypothetical protein